MKFCHATQASSLLLLNFISMASAVPGTTLSTIVTGIPSTTVANVPTSTLSGIVIPPSATAQSEAMKPYLYKCSAQQANIINQAWSEAGTIAKAGASWEPPGYFTGAKYQSAMDLYIGTQSRKDNGLFGGVGPVKSNILRQQGIHFTSADWSPGRSYAYFYCDEAASGSKAGLCARGAIAYTWDNNGFIWNAKYVVLCPDFFSSTDTLASMTARAKTDKNIQTTIDPWYNTQALSMFHETYHWYPEVSQPKCNLRPEIYAASDVVALAKSNYAQSTINAESYNDAALAIYLQQTFNLANPPVPRSMASAQVQAAVPPTNITATTTFLDTAPDGFVPPVNVNIAVVNGGEPSESGWEQLV